MIKILNENDNFEKIILEGRWLVDFSASWCMPCRMMEPVLEELSNKVQVMKVDIDKFPELTSSFGIMSVPIVIIFENGKVKDKLIGLRSMDEFEKVIK